MKDITLLQIAAENLRAEAKRIIHKETNSAWVLIAWCSFIAQAVPVAMSPCLHVVLVYTRATHNLYLFRSP